MSDIQSQLSLDLPLEQQLPAHTYPEKLREEILTLFAVRRPDFIRFLARLGVDAGEAEDITQDAFLRLFDASKEAKHPDRPYEWLLTCVRNLALKRFRRCSREIQVIDDVWKMWERSVGDPSSDPEAEYEARECSRRWRQALASLSPESQQCILLRSEGVTFREIASILGLPMRRVVYLTNMALTDLQVLVRKSEV